MKSTVSIIQNVLLEITSVKLGELERILRELPKRGADNIFTNINLTGLYV